MSALPRRLVEVLLASCIVVGLLTSANAPASSLPREPFVAGQAYRGNFPDPTVIRVGNRYYAHATTTGWLSLPTLTSTDLRTWVARPASDPTLPWTADGMSRPGPWVRQTTRADGTTFSPTWAPSVAAVPGYGYAAAYSAPWTFNGRRCIAIARAASPLGPFVDTSYAPLTCGMTGTGIDPQLFRDGGRTYLLLKSAGAPNRLVVRQLDVSATRFATGSTWRILLVPRQAWEGGVVENPAMVRYHRRLYLFWSGNVFDTTRYATGYAVCKTVLGPCRRKGRLLMSNSALAGPGGATPFLDAAGGLRLAYHAWRTAEAPYLKSAQCRTQQAACPARRMYVATLAPARKGRLKVVRAW